MPDDPESWTFDDDFVRAGRHEPSARTREALARYGGRRTSWRAPGAPAGADLAVASRRRRTGRRGPWIASVIGLVAALVGFCVWIWHTRTDDSRGVAVPPAGRDRLVFSPTPQTTTEPDARVRNLGPRTKVGACFTAPHDDPAIDLHPVGCRTAHDYEVVAIRRAARSSRYPSWAYWQDAVLPACRQSLADYAGRQSLSSGDTVDGRTASYFSPTAASWADGNRTVYCVAVSTAPRTGSVHR